jgi:hypothetical protein
MAASPANTLAGGARVRTCAGCAGGHEVRYIGKGGTLAFNGVETHVAGDYAVTVVYCLPTAPREAYISVDNGLPLVVKFSPTGSWTTPGSTTITLVLKDGRNTIRFGNSDAGAPDISELLVAGQPTVVKPPAAPVSLTGWQLTLPVDLSGCQCGSATMLSPAAITPPWLVRNTDGSLTFWAPTKGATTPHSLHPRTELVSMSGFTGGSRTHTLTETLSVQALPPANDIIVAQVHGGGLISSVPLVMLHYRAGRIVDAVRTSVTVDKVSEATVLTGVPLSASFSFTITAGSTGFVISVAYGTRTGHLTVPLPAPFRGMDLRFQTGDYQQTDANSSTTEGGRLTITALSAT